VRKALEKMGWEHGSFFKGVGCRHCRNTGFSGRIGIHELLILDDEIRDAIVSNPALGVISNLARRKGMITLGYDGFRKMREGITTIEEVLQTAGEFRDFSPADAATK
jgi:type IV pilus assembly protein PilB